MIELLLYLVVVGLSYDYLKDKHNHPILASILWIIFYPVAVMLYFGNDEEEE